MKDHKQSATETAGKGHLSFLSPRETRRVSQARANRRYINLFRLILPIISILALAGLVIWPLVNPDKLVGRVLKNVPDLVIQNLNFTDVDSKNEPYSISAEKATRPSGDKEIYDLDHPRGEITLQQGSWLAAKSQYGRYDKEKNQLWLGGDVQLFHDKGYEFTTDEMQADLNDHSAWGKKPVLIQGGFGEVRGDGFMLLDSGHVFVVKGPAKALLNLHGTEASDKPNTSK